MKVGDEVVCILPERDAFHAVLRKGETYVVQAIEGPIALGNLDTMVWVRGAGKTIIAYSWRFQLKDKHELRHNGTAPT